ncbi:hypothetical protein Ahy_B04g068966 isoform B [Arachis hypogaea]|uniref:Nudix hydrolase 3 n=1 Tax=Arachis hypogaea TaxID=3818 RepID=A0A444ZBA7_ARAHY|nr:hypothetical protein Ahy_B04g068966 isoform A [Arachis hypogaea]RYR11445.1 hypothetical protein Ahy_B04g068966 isoform B [Arachis hypogaea]
MDNEGIGGVRRAQRWVWWRMCRWKMQQWVGSGEIRQPMEDSKLDVTIGPYETYEDKLFGYKATFEAYIGIRDDEATAQLKLFGDNLKVQYLEHFIVNNCIYFFYLLHIVTDLRNNFLLKLLEENLPMDSAYKSKDVNAAPIRVIQLTYNAGDVKGPQTLAFNLPNDERIVNDRGTSMVMLKNVSEAKFKHILLPIAAACVAVEQQEFVDFESFFTHTICHECCHGIGPHTITLPDGQKSTVRLDLLSESLLKSMYVSFLAGCFRSVRFGLEEAHGKGQALQFNWLYEKGAFILHSDNKVSVDFSKIEGAVESLSREILTIQAKGDKEAAGLLLQKYSVMTEPLKIALKTLENVQVPVDVAPTFPIANEILH